MGLQGAIAKNLQLAAFPSPFVYSALPQAVRGLATSLTDLMKIAPPSSAPPSGKLKIRVCRPKTCVYVNDLADEGKLTPIVQISGSHIFPTGWGPAGPVVTTGLDAVGPVPVPLQPFDPQPPLSKISLGAPPSAATVDIMATINGLQMREDFVYICDCARATDPDDLDKVVASVHSGKQSPPTHVNGLRHTAPHRGVQIAPESEKDRLKKIQQAVLSLQNSWTTPNLRAYLKHVRKHS